MHSLISVGIVRGTKMCQELPAMAKCDWEISERTKQFLIRAPLNSSRAGTYPRRPGPAQDLMLHHHVGSGKGPAATGPASGLQGWPSASTP